jgi:CRP-like cAMP-binding protein
MPLQHIELFRDFTPEERERFAPVIQALDLPDGHVLFEEGDPGDALYIVESGVVRIFKRIDRDLGTEKSLAILEAGKYLGEMTILDGTPRSASARTEGPSRILKISRTDFLNVLRTYPQAVVRLFVSFMKVMAQRLREADEELVVLYEVGKIIGNSPPLDELLREILARTMAPTRAGLGAVFFLNDIINRLEVREASGEGSVELLNLKIPVGQGIVGQAVAANKLLRIDDFESSESAALPRFGFERKRMLIAPLVRADQPFGAIFLADRIDDKPFDGANVNLVSAVASQASAAVESALHQQAAAAKEQLDRHYFQF